MPLTKRSCQTGLRLDRVPRFDCQLVILTELIDRSVVQISPQCLSPSQPCFQIVHRRLSDNRNQNSVVRTVTIIQFVIERLWTIRRDTDERECDGSVVVRCDFLNESSPVSPSSGRPSMISLIAVMASKWFEIPGISSAPFDNALPDSPHGHESCREPGKPSRDNDSVARADFPSVTCRIQFVIGYFDQGLITLKIQVSVVGKGDIK